MLYKQLFVLNFFVSSIFIFSAAQSVKKTKNSKKIKNSSKLFSNNWIVDRTLIIQIINNFLKFTRVLQKSFVFKTTMHQKSIASTKNISKKKTHFDKKFFFFRRKTISICQIRFKSKASVYLSNRNRTIAKTKFIRYVNSYVERTLNAWTKSRTRSVFFQFIFFYLTSFQSKVQKKSIVKRTLFDQKFKRKQIVRFSRKIVFRSWKSEICADDHVFRDRSNSVLNERFFFDYSLSFAFSHYEKKKKNSSRLICLFFDQFFWIFHCEHVIFDFFIVFLFCIVWQTFFF